MKKNLFYTMLAATFLMVGCGSTENTAVGSTGSDVTGKAGGTVVSSTEMTVTPKSALAGSDTGR